MYTKRFAFLGAIAMVAMVGCETSTGPENGAVQGTSEALIVATSDAPVLVIASLPVLEVVGSSKVTRNKNGATATLQTSVLDAGNAYTMWMVVFNAPGECAHFEGAPCLESELFGEVGDGSVLFVTGHVVGDDGQATFSGRISKDDTRGALFGPGLANPRGAEIHLVVRDHGPAIPGQIPSQIHTFQGGCTAASSFDPGFGDFECADILASIHQP